MRIALDFDNTYTLDPTGWDMVIDIWKGRGHDVRCVTARSATEDRTAPIVDLERRIPVIYTNGIAKAYICQYLDWVPDVWVDDKVININNNSTTSPEKLADWRATRGEGPSFPKEKNRMTKLPAGKYWIGDLCYVLRDQWDEVCSLTISGNDCLEGVFTLADGTSFGTLNTAHGDGEYLDLSRARHYPVDSGTIGCVLADKVDDKLSGGHVLDIPYEFEPRRDGGYLIFGWVVIDTNI